MTRGRFPGAGRSGRAEPGSEETPLRTPALRRSFLAAPAFPGWRLRAARLRAGPGGGGGGGGHLLSRLLSAAATVAGVTGGAAQVGEEASEAGGQRPT